MDRSFFTLNISDDILQQIKKIIDEKDNCNCDYHISGSSVWFQAESQETELRLLTLGDYSMTISRVGFVNQRCGTMTAILDLLLNYCKTKGIKKFTVQSVCTPEMANFCLKHGITPDPHAIMEMDNGFIFGDYCIEIA